MILWALAALWCTGPAYAQETDTETATEEAGEAAAEETSGEASSAAEADSSDNATAGQKAIDEDAKLFWAERRKVNIVQRRLFEKDGKLELTPYFGVVPNDDFIVYYPMGLRAGYHFSEAFAVEASFAYASESNSDLADFLENEIGLNRAQLRQIVKMYYNVNLLWSPIYGKISFLGQKLTHFDLYVGIGAGNTHLDEFTELNPEPNNKTDNFGGNYIVGFRWYLTDLINVRTDFRHYFFPKVGGGISKLTEITGGVGILFDAF
ncbi:MAG: outer membrane beta-barrel domain-containing protein [Bradymonadia bacterium]